MKSKFSKIISAGVFVILILSLALAGCGVGARFDQPAITSVTVEVAEDRAGGEATGSPVPAITTPAPGGTPAQQEGLPGIPIRILIETVNFDIVNEVGDTEGDGYIIYYLDELPEVIQRGVEGVLPSGVPGPAGQLQSADSRRVTTTETEFVWENVSQGLHIVSAQLVDPQGNPLNPPAVVSVAAVIPQPRPEETGGATPGG